LLRQPHFFKALSQAGHRHIVNTEFDKGALRSRHLGRTAVD
jgi:hypothetical protein